MTEVILDTNFLLIPGYFNVDIISEIERICPFPFELVVLQGTIEELENIVRTQKGANLAAAAIGKELIKKNPIRILEYGSGSEVDDSIVDYAVKNSAVVATEDRELIKKLKNKGIQVIILRQKKYLQISEA